MKIMNNYLSFKGLRKTKYAYIDTSEYLADSLFYKREITVKFKQELVKEGEEYRIIICEIKNKDTQKFEEALEELKNKMLLYKHNSYEEYCKSLIGLLTSDDN